MWVCLSVCLSCLFVCLSICLSVCLSVGLEHKCLVFQSPGVPHVMVLGSWGAMGAQGPAKERTGGFMECSGRCEDGLWKDVGMHLGNDMEPEGHIET